MHNAVYRDPFHGFYDEEARTKIKMLANNANGGSREERIYSKNLFGRSTIVANGKICAFNLRKLVGEDNMKWTVSVSSALDGKVAKKDFYLLLNGTFYDLFAAEIGC